MRDTRSRARAGPKEEADVTGMRYMFTPYIGVRAREKEALLQGAGAWAEFGPLFDGKTWNEARCRVVPHVCHLLRDDESLCRSDRGTTHRCGTDVIVTILRLRPGSTIVPHCGTTNNRLIMHFPITGAEGVEFTVGGERVLSYGGGDGSPVVFDDSFEHFVEHKGQADRFVVLAVLQHPDTRALT